MRDWKAEAAPFVQPLTEALRRPGGDQTLRIAQTAAALDLHEVGGLFLNGRVGVGKSLIVALSNTVLSAGRGPLRTLIAVPGGLIKPTNEHHAEIARHWNVLPGAMLLSYSKISLMPKRGESLENLFGPGLGPELLVFDEADKLSNVGANGSALALQVEQYIHDHPEVIVVCVTGTCDARGIPDYAHLVHWCLRERSPLPRSRDEILDLSDVLDDGNLTNAPWVRKFLKLPPTADLDAMREAYYLLLRGTRGIIVEDTPYTAIPLVVREWALEPPPELEQHWERLRDLGQRPDGADVEGGPPEPDRVDPMGAWAVARRMGRGLCYVWDPLPPEEWLRARREYYSWERRYIGKQKANGRIITPAVAREYAETAQHPRWVRWAAVQPTYTPQSKTLWLSDAALNAAEAWGRQAPGIIFVDDRDFGAELARRTGWDYYPTSKRVRGRPLENKKEGVSSRTVIASRHANGTGLNLQFQWRRILFVSPPNSSRDFEQNTGRCHREGAEMSFQDVEVTMLLTCAEDYGSVRKVIRSAQRTAKSIYRQKAVDWKWDRLKQPPSGGPENSRAFG